jgi:CheY-like chemotaxis protein
VAVMEAEDLKQARSLLRAGEYPTTVLLDLELPDGNGLDLMCEVPPTTKVIALSADDCKETRLRCRAAGCAAMLSKGEGLGDLDGLVKAVRPNASPPPTSTGHDSALDHQYVEYLAETRLTLQQAREHRDFHTVRRIAHRLRGTAVHFGQAGVGTSARAVGTALASGGTTQIEAALEDLQQRICAAIESHHLASSNSSKKESHTCGS